MEDRGKQTLGILLIVLGVLFLLLNMGLLWFGWEAVWPLFPFLAGLLTMRLYASQRRPVQLFAALVLTQLGLFFSVFSVGAAPWSDMATLWPFLILIPGIASLAVAATGKHRVSALIVGLAAVAVAVVGFWAARGRADSGVLAPLVRFWPVALIVAGVMIFRRASRRPKPPSEPREEGIDTVRKGV